MKKQILAVTLCSLACSLSCSAGWDTNAWPSTEVYRFVVSTNEDHRVASTNLWARRHEIIFSQDSTTNYIPAVSSLDACWDLYHLSNGYVPWFFDPRLSGIAIAAAVTNTRAWTNTFYDKIAADVPANVVASWIFPPGGWGLPATSTATFVMGGITQTAHTVCHSHITTGVVLSIKLDAADVWAMDCYQARMERWRMLNPQDDPTAGYPYPAYYSFDLSQRPVYYKSARENLIAHKAWISDNATSFLDPAADQIAALSNTADFAYLTLTGLLSSAGAPTNYLTYTPWRELSGQGIGEGHVVTSSFTIAAAPGETVTNTVSDYCGNAVDISGTNGQVVSIVCTNTDVQAGYSTLDYGWKYAREIVNPLVIVKSYYATAASVSGEMYGVQILNTGTCSLLESELPLHPIGGTWSPYGGIWIMRSAAAGSRPGDLGGYQYYTNHIGYAKEINWSVEASQCATCMSHRVEFYAKPCMPGFPTNATTAYYNYTDQDYWQQDAWSMFSSVDSTSDIVTSDTIGRTNGFPDPFPPCDEPTWHYPLGSETTNDWHRWGIDIGSYRATIRYDITNGATYIHEE